MEEELRQLVQERGDDLSLGLVLFIVAVAIACFVYIFIQKEKDDLLRHRGVIEMLPTVVSTLGVLGTFAGITLGLYFFDSSPDNLKTSIPLLLNGLKTAFFTSLTGMVLSMILSGQVNKLFDEKTDGVNDSVAAANLVVQELKELKQEFQNLSKSQRQFYQTAQKWDSGLSKVDALYETFKGITTSMDANLKSLAVQLSNIDGKALSIEESIGNIEENSESLVHKADESKRLVGEMNSQTSTLVSDQKDIMRHVSTFGDKLHSEVLDIESKMDNTNTLLKNKFEEFAELLKKSNTEALVEVMKNVTKEFQKQMTTLINKLVQENFQELNNSVKLLNTWQQENKAMIQSLTSQYQQMAKNFESTSTSLTKVDEDTRHLVSEGGRLHQIVDALSQVIVQDEKFIRISSDLQKTAELAKTNYEQFDEATKHLNDWVKKQRNFVDSVVVLIKKLEELASIRNYTDEFWRDTKTGMNEAVGIIREGSESLNRQVSTLNSQFYSRLSTTLTELDNCIRAIIEQEEP